MAIIVEEEQKRSNLFGIIGVLQKRAGIELHVTPRPR